MGPLVIDRIDSLLDFRGNSHRSPFVWCIHCRKLCRRREDTYTMTSAYRPTETSIYPCGVCDMHEERNRMYGSEE